MFPAILEGLRLCRLTDAIPDAAAMDLAIAGPSMTGASRAGGAPEERAARERINAVIRDSRLSSRESSAEPSLRRLPLIRPEQPVNIIASRQKLIAFFTNIAIYYNIVYAIRMMCTILLFVIETA
jgi:Flp pilus assembly protein TadB